MQRKAAQRATPIARSASRPRRVAITWGGTDTASFARALATTPIPRCRETGTAAIAGHRTTYGAPFRDIDQLDRGDRIVLDCPTAFTYRVTRTKDRGRLRPVGARPGGYKQLSSRLPSPLQRGAAVIRVRPPGEPPTAAGQARWVSRFDRSSSEASRDSNHRIKPTTNATRYGQYGDPVQNLEHHGGRAPTLTGWGGCLPPTRDLGGIRPCPPAARPGLFRGSGGERAGYFPTTWYLGALLWLAPAGHHCVAVGAPRGLPKPLVIAIALLGGYAIWPRLDRLGEPARRGLDGANRLPPTCWSSPFRGLAARRARRPRAYHLFRPWIVRSRLRGVLSAGAGTDPLDSFMGTLLGTDRYPSGLRPCSRWDSSPVCSWPPGATAPGSEGSRLGLGGCGPRSLT